jgi:hypothetical protein
MKKKILLVLMALVLVFTSLGAAPMRLVRLKVVNKSAMQIEISLTGKYLDNFYYLHVPEGSSLIPLEQGYTVVPDTYSSSVYFVELWDPVYGHKCTDKAQTLDARRNVVLIVFACAYTPPNAGEPPSLVKYGGRLIKRGR